MRWRKEILRQASSIGLAQTGPKPAVLGAAEFQFALQREWSRADRIHLPLTLVTISPVANESRQENQKHIVLGELAGLLEQRVRCTDIIGWYENGQLGLLLPHTSGEDDWILINDFQSQLEGHLQNGDLQGRYFQFDVFTYTAE